MTTIGYGALTRQRLLAQPSTSSTLGSPGVRGYVDSLAALVPAEVLGLHAIVIGLTTTTVRQADGNSVMRIVDPSTLRLSFWGLVAISCAFYLVGHRGGPWTRGDYGRVLIPPASVVLWTMLQPGSAFDAVAPGWAQTSRITTATFGAIALGLIAGQLSRTADSVQPFDATQIFHPSAPPRTPGTRPKSLGSPPPDTRSLEYR